MTAPKRLTRRLFWRHWPEVAPGFAIGPNGLMRADRHCPLSAVAECLGMLVRNSLALDAAFRGRDWPKWADDVIDAADGREKGDTYRRLVEHIPEGNR